MSSEIFNCIPFLKKSRLKHAPLNKAHVLSLPDLAPCKRLLISSSEQFLTKKQHKSFDANKVAPFKILQLKNNLKFP